ncbi:MAG TPA: hypothetical protein VF840_08750 [Terriglobales bacterium]
METNPFSDTVSFLLQPARTTAVFWLLLIASVAIAVINWMRDSRQHTFRDV